MIPAISSSPRITEKDWRTLGDICRLISVESLWESFSIMLQFEATRTAQSSGQHFYAAFSRLGFALRYVFARCGAAGMPVWDVRLCVVVCGLIEAMTRVDPAREFRGHYDCRRSARAARRCAADAALGAWFDGAQWTRCFGSLSKWRDCRSHFYCSKSLACLIHNTLIGAAVRLNLSRPMRPPELACAQLSPRLISRRLGGARTCAT
jgi:hypothetical protein